MKGRMSYNYIHIQEAIVYEQLFEFKSNFKSHVIRNLEPISS